MKETGRSNTRPSLARILLTISYTDITVDVPACPLVTAQRWVAEHTDTKFLVDNLKVEMFGTLSMHSSQALNTFSTAIPQPC